MSTGGLLDLADSANAGGKIPGATILVNVPGDLVAQGGAIFTIQSTGFNFIGGPFIGGGTIGGDATLILNVGNVTTGDLLDLEIDNNAAGNIGGNASMTLLATGNIDSQTDAFFDIVNTADLDGTTLLPSGTIGGAATIVASVNGAIDVQGNGEFAVLNNVFRFLAGGGTIGGDGIVALTAASISTGGFFQPLVNNNNGTIGGTAAVGIGVTGDISVGTITFFNLLNSGGVIGGDAISGFTAANFSSGSTFEFQIVNDAGGSIGGDASLEAALSGSLTSPSTATERSHSILPAFRQMCLKLARLAQMVCSISAAAPSRVTPRWNFTRPAATDGSISLPTSPLMVTAQRFLRLIRLPFSTMLSSPSAAQMRPMFTPTARITPASAATARRPARLLARARIILNP